MKKIFALFTLALVFIACKQQEKPMAKAEMKKDTIAVTASKPANLKSLDIAYKKDPVCGMPITAGLEDTLLYEGKIVGFCAAECKASFVKNPTAYKLTIK